MTIFIGMAGSGKTTLFHRLHYDAQEKGRRCYFVNLDPGGPRSTHRAPDRHPGYHRL